MSANTPHGHPGRSLSTDLIPGLFKRWNHELLILPLNNNNKQTNKMGKREKLIFFKLWLFLLSPLLSVSGIAIFLFFLIKKNDILGDGT